MFLSAVPTNAPVLVVVVTQHGCGHCDEYLPRFLAIARSYPDLAFMNVDAADQRPETQAWMDQHKLESTPSTYVLRHNARGGGSWRVEGAVDDAQIKGLLDHARSVR